MTADTRTPAFSDFAAIFPGQEVRITRRIASADIDAFARLTGDFNPLHVDPKFAARTRFGKRVAHGMLSAAQVSTLVGMYLPGPGALWTQQSFDFLGPVYEDDEIEFVLRVTHKSEATRSVSIDVEARNQNGLNILKGRGSVMVLEELMASAPGREQLGHVALVTGAARGIGAAIATELARTGLSVVVNYHTSKQAAATVVENILSGGGAAIAVQADVTDRSAVASMLDQVRSEFGHDVDVLVNNAAGPAPSKPFVDTTWENISAQFDVQVRGAYTCVSAVAPGMIERGFGKIINIGSTATWGAPPPKFLPYVVAKHALHGLTRSLAVELGPHGIRVNSVSPGTTHTGLTADLPERTTKVLAMQTPLRDLATPTDVGRVVAMLCSPAGNFIQGVDVPVCGGAVM